MRKSPAKIHKIPMREEYFQSLPKAICFEIFKYSAPDIFIGDQIIFFDPNKNNHFMTPVFVVDSISEHSGEGFGTTTFLVSCSCNILDWCSPLKGFRLARGLSSQKPEKINQVKLELNIKF